MRPSRAAERIGIDQGVEDCQQRGCEAEGGRSRRGRGHAGGNGEDEVQEFGAICREGDVHEDGESDARQLEETEKSRANV